MNLTRAALSCLIILSLAAPAFAQEYVLERLNDSPRHHEWVEVKHGDRVVHSFLVYPEVSETATAVLVIHENRGLTDWVRGVADRLAEEGYIAIAPDLLSGMGPDDGKTSDFADTDAARNALYQLDQNQITADLHAVADYVTGLDACNGTLVVGGFCWGGSQTFHFATQRDDLAAACVFYGTPVDDPELLKQIDCTVYGFYGGNDNRVTSTVPGAQEAMDEAGKDYQPVTYEGAGHGFMRSGEAPDASPENREAHDMGWKRWLEILENAE